MRFFHLILLSGFALSLSACGPKAFVKGTYDDVERENLLNDQWSETDMQKACADLVASLVKHPKIANAQAAPIVVVTGLKNNTSEHIETSSILDMIRVELMKTGKVAFIDREARGDIADEYNYQEGNVSEATRTRTGNQTGAQFIINGRLESNVQEVGKDKTVYYKLTLNMTDLKTSVMTWSDHKQIRKTFRKRSVGF